MILPPSGLTGLYALAVVMENWIGDKRLGVLESWRDGVLERKNPSSDRPLFPKSHYSNTQLLLFCSFKKSGLYAAPNMATIGRGL
jgi:hypothetical protein